MLTRRTVIGMAAGIIITSIGIAALVSSFGVQDVMVNDSYEPGQSGAYRFEAPPETQQKLELTGERFDVNLEHLGDGLTESYENRTVLVWSSSGQNRLAIANTGAGMLDVTGTLYISTDPIFFTYHILVITSGVIIMGFSAGFSIRKPRGF